MANFYADSATGNDANPGTLGSPKATLGAALALMSAPDDQVIGFPGSVFRETGDLPIDGSDGHRCKLIGDYTGALTGRPKGVCRITGSNDDMTISRASAITASGRSFWDIEGWKLDTCSDFPIVLTNCTDITLDKGLVVATKQLGALWVKGASQARIAFKRQRVYGGANGVILYYSNGSAVDDTGHTIESVVCEGLPGAIGVYIERVGGISATNLTIRGASIGVLVGIAMTSGQKIVLRRSIVADGTNGLIGAVLGDIDFDYGALYGNVSNSSTVTLGANNVTYPPLFDDRGWFEAVNGGRLVTPWDLSSASQLINTADGGSAATLDARGTAVIGGNREPGVFEYDATLLAECGAPGGGGVSRARIVGGV